jgi:nitroreductase
MSAPAPPPVVGADPERLDDEALLDAFEAAAFAPGSFHHRHHVRVAWALLERRDVLDVLQRFSAGLRRLAAAAGKPGLYHETITWAFVLLVHERRASAGHEDWTAFAERNADLLEWKPSVLEKRYYTEKTLWSARARSSFVLPDRRL